MERVKDRQNIIAKMKGGDKQAEAGKSTDPNMISLLPRSETVPPNYLWELLGKLTNDAQATEANVNALSKQMNSAVRRSGGGVAQGDTEGTGGTDVRERIQGIITNNHKLFFGLAGRVSVNNSKLKVKKIRILRGGYASGNKAVEKLQGLGAQGGDRLDKKLKEEINKFRVQQAQTALAAGAPGAPAPAAAAGFGGFGQQQTSTTGGGFGAFGSPAAAAPTAALGGFGGFGSPQPQATNQQTGGGFGGFGGFGGTAATTTTTQGFGMSSLQAGFGGGGRRRRERGRNGDEGKERG